MLNRETSMLRNISINLRASGPAAVLIAWMLCFTALALFGAGSLAAYAQGVMATMGVLLLVVLGQSIE